jgi:hypothetical protein
LNFTLSNEQRAISIMRQQEDANAAAGIRTDGLEVRMDSVEERVGKVEEMVRRLVCCDKQPWIHVPHLVLDRFVE